MAGVRRALRAQLSRALSAGERIDNLRTAVIEAVRAPPHFGLVPDCSSAASLSSADPYFDIAKLGQVVQRLRVCRRHRCCRQDQGRGGGGCEGLVAVLCRMGLPAVDKDLTWEPRSE